MDSEETMSVTSDDNGDAPVIVKSKLFALHLICIHMDVLLWFDDNVNSRKLVLVTSTSNRLNH